MQITRVLPVSEDQRGRIADILVGEVIDAVTIIESKKGSVRGNHFHKDTIQWIYVLSGRIVVAAKREGSPLEEREVVPGDLVRHDPFEAHSVRAIEDSAFVVLTRGPRSGEAYEDDTYRLETPLQRQS